MNFWYRANVPEHSIDHPLGSSPVPYPRIPILVRYPAYGVEPSKLVPLCEQQFLQICAAQSESFRLIRIFIVDDSAIARNALKTALAQRPDWVVVGEAVDGHHALATFHLHTPHLTLMDFIMPEMNGLETARQLTSQHSDVLILMVTTSPSNQLEIEARRVGIKGLCAKNEMHCLVKAIDTVLAGGTYFSTQATA